MDVDTIVLDIVQEIVQGPVNLIVCIHVPVHVVENLSKYLFNRGLYVFNKIILTNKHKEKRLYISPIYRSFNSDDL